MILVTLGTQDKSFERLLKMLDLEIEKGNIKEKVIVQAGLTKYESKNMEIKGLIPMEELDDLMNKCDILITHGGVGSIISGLKKGKKVIACARLKKYKEHTNDHQKQIIDNFKADGYILDLDDFDSIGEAIKASKKFTPKKYKSNNKKFVKLIKERIDDPLPLNKRENSVLKIDLMFSIIMFLLFLLICSYSPLTGDDWGNYINGSGGFFPSIKYAINSYHTYEGRFFSRIFINILTFHKEIWNFINPLMISLMYFLILRITKHKDKFITPAMLFLSFLLIDVEAFRQSYVWLAGNITYLFPSLLIFIILFINKNEKSRYKGITYIILPIISFICSMFVEVVSVGIIVGYLTYIIYYYIKNRKIDLCLLISFLVTLIGLILMAFSPGTMKRLDEYPEFARLTLIGKIKYNIPNFINFTFIRNSFLILLTIFVIYNLGFKYIKNKLILSFVYIYSTVIPFFTALVYYAGTLGISISKLNFLLNYKNVFIIVFWLIYSLILLYLFIKYIKEYKNISIIYLVCVGLFSNFSMFVSPIWGGRTSFLTTICLSSAMIIILSKNKFIINNNKFLQISSMVTLSLFSIFLVFGYRSVYEDEIFRKEMISRDIKENRDVIRIFVLSERFLWNPNPWSVDGWLYKTIKKYYKIAPSKDLELIFKRDL